MNYGEKLVTYMWNREIDLCTVLGKSHVGYMSKQAEVIIRMWSAEECRRVWEIIVSSIEKDMGNAYYFRAEWCPFCHHSACDDCEYVKLRGDCTPDFSRMEEEIVLSMTPSLVKRLYEIIIKINGEIRGLDVKELKFNIGGTHDNEEVAVL